MSGYDRALSVFSPDGHVFQVEYAAEAVKRGTAAVGIKGKNVAVLACERRSALKLHDTRTMPSKLCRIDHHITLAFAGLNADARVLIDYARVDVQNKRINSGEAVTVEQCTKNVAGLMQRYTQQGGVRPFGVSTLIIGFDAEDDTPRLYHTEPSGIYSAWKANAIGRSSKTVREVLEKHYTEDMSEEASIKLAIQSLLEVVQTGAKNIEVAVALPGKRVRVLTFDEIDQVVKDFEREAEEQAELARKPRKSNLATAAS